MHDVLEVHHVLKVKGSGVRRASYALLQLAVLYLVVTASHTCDLIYGLILLAALMVSGIRYVQACSIWKMTYLFMCFMMDLREIVP